MSHFTNNSAVVFAEEDAGIDILDSSFTNTVGTLATINARFKSSVNVTRTNFTRNQASAMGDVLVVYHKSTAIVDSCNFIDNGFFIQNLPGSIVVANNSSSLEVKNSEFTHSNSGDAIWAKFYSSVVVESCNFVKNVGGVQVWFSSLKLTDSVFTNNTRPQQPSAGAAVYLVGTDATISGSVFVGNKVTFEGGAVVIADGDTTIDDCSFENNHATVHGGGAIYMGTVAWKGRARISNSNFTGNRGDPGGAVMVDSTMRLDMQHCTFDDNHADYTAGGGVMVNSGSIFTVQDSVFSRNTGRDGGGAIAVNYHSSLTVDGVNFTANFALVGSGGGGGGAIGASGTCAVDVARSSFLHNSVDQGAGASISVQDESTLHVHGSRFLNGVSNQSSGAIAVMIESYAEIANCLIANNTALAGGALVAGQGGMIILKDSVVNSNTALGQGGGFAYMDAGDLSLDTCDVSSNTAFYGGAIKLTIRDNLRLSRTSFTDNQSPQGSDIFFTLPPDSSDEPKVGGALFYTHSTTLTHGSITINSSTPGFEQKAFGTGFIESVGGEAAIQETPYAAGKRGLVAQNVSHVFGVVPLCMKSDKFSNPHWNHQTSVAPPCVSQPFPSFASDSPGLRRGRLSVLQHPVSTGERLQLQQPEPDEAP